MQQPALTWVPYIFRVLSAQRESTWSGSWLRVVAGVATPVCMLLLLAAPGDAFAGVGSISGHMTKGGAEIPGIAEGLVCALKSEKEERVQGENCELGSLPDGAYTISNLSSGDYKIQFWPGYALVNWIWEYYDDTRVWSQAPWIEVSNGSITGIDGELAEGGYISGRVTRASDGEGLAGAHVCAEEPLAEFTECKEVGVVGGSYQLYGLIEGDYVVEFLPAEGQGVRAQFYNGKSESGGADLVHVTTGVQTEPIDAALPAEATITGRVTDAATHAGLEEIEVCAFELMGPEVIGCEYTEPSGSYAITDLPVGTYKLGFFSESVEEEEGLESSPYRVQFWNDKPSWEAANILTLGLGLTAGIDAELGTPPPSQLQVSILPALMSSALPTSKTPRAHCRSGRRWKKVKGKMRCVKLHKPTQHKRAHQRHSRHRLTS